MTIPTTLGARIAYALIAMPIGATLGYVLTLKLLLKAASSFAATDPGMQDLHSFMIALSVSCTFALTTSLFALTLPWVRPLKARPKGRILLTAACAALYSLGLLVPGDGLILIAALTVWTSAVLYYTCIRHGILDAKLIH